LNWNLAAVVTAEFLHVPRLGSNGKTGPFQQKYRP